MLHTTPGPNFRPDDPGEGHSAPDVGPCALVLFGVTGDLARKKLIPAVYDLASQGLLPPTFSLVGYGRRGWDHEVFVKEVKESVQDYARTPFVESVWQELARGIRFVSGDFSDPSGFRRLRDVLRELDENHGTAGSYLFYLSVAPKAFGVICEQLSQQGLARSGRAAWPKVIIEKPFGHDLASARELNRTIETFFDAASVFRVDHYLGKEAVQNVLTLRFANRLFDALWNAEHIDHVQITMAEDIGVDGRGGYYEGVGAGRDVMQNHLLQLLALTAMERPPSFTAENIAEEKARVLSAVRIPADLSQHSARGRYGEGRLGGQKITGFLAEAGIPADSTTETYAAVRLAVDTQRWKGVPFYLRTGKRLERRVTEIAVVFKASQHVSPSELNSENALVIRIQPEQGATAHLSSKVPGRGMEIRDVTMDFNYSTAFSEESLEAYERLILDALLNDHLLFPPHREIELSWQVMDPIERYWAAAPGAPEHYQPGSWGPASGDALMTRDGRSWRRP
ncbi:glucose-6-phosphate dehydrogenase [Pseudarthrobacter sp. S9]|uniref:glucose-6-phosphate dehydrogenase n=1 Tax=Pseudarthrobacter sp. S9 TaxID=3418421 RepID=UPI003D07A6A6